MRRHSPDHDPDLRAAFALDAEAQRALLQQLCGVQAQPGAATTGQNFQPVPVTARRIARGAFMCLPTEWPGDAMLSPDTEHVKICIDHAALNRRSQPRLPAAVAALQDALDTCGPHRGILTLPFRPPRTWTLDTIRDVIGLMAQYLPSSASHTGKYRADVTADCGRARIHVAPETRPYHARKDGPYSAEVYLPMTTPAISEWQRLFYGYYGGGTLEFIDQRLAQYRAERSTPRNTPAPDDDPDPLDAIEQAARRTLHPEPPRRATDPSGDNREATLRKVGRLTGTDPIHIATLDVMFRSMDVLLVCIRRAIENRERGQE
jgi:hypothetical protein